MISDRRGWNFSLLFIRWPCKEGRKEANEERPQIADRADLNKLLAHIARVLLAVHAIHTDADGGAGGRVVSRIIGGQHFIRLANCDLQDAFEEWRIIQRHENRRGNDENRQNNESENHQSDAENDEQSSHKTLILKCGLRV